MTYFENKENIKVDLKKFKNLVVEYYRYISNICLCYDDKNFEQLRGKYIFIKEYLETLNTFDNTTLKELKKIYLEYLIDKIFLDEFNTKNLVIGIIQKQQKHGINEENISLIAKCKSKLNKLNIKIEILKRQI